MSKWASSALVVTLLSLGCSPMYLAARPPVELSGYRGDGTIDPLKHPINPGYKIDFVSFSLAMPVTATYRLDGLPRPRHHSACQVALAVELTPDEAARWPTVPIWLTAASLGGLAIRVKSQSGPIVLDFSAQLAGQYWQRRTGEQTLFAVLRTSAKLPAAFSSKPDQLPSVLEVSYEPGNDSISRLGNVQLVVGGED